VTARDPEAGSIRFVDEEGTEREVPVTGGHCKLQWKPDWAMRWYALGVDYEMSGKDLIPSVDLASKITRALGGRPPDGFNYELFLDDKGQKISKSKGNGLAVEDWLRYAPPESLALYMYQQPRRAKRLYFDVIPRAVDEYITFSQKFPGEAEAARLENPVWHIHSGDPSALDCPLTFNMLLNLTGVAHAEEPSVLWGFISRYAPGETPDTAPFLDRLVGYAINYYRDFVKPTKRFRAANDTERTALAELLGRLGELPGDATAEDIQTEIYEIGKRHPFGELKDWFRGIYEVLFGQSEGPRMGSFVKIYGIAETRALIENALAGKLGDA
jgi:lysyl-tRNA synthetase class 1